MRKFTVYTDRGIYTDVLAYSKEHAKKVIWKRTLGREDMKRMTVTAQ